MNQNVCNLVYSFFGTHLNLSSHGKYSTFIIAPYLRLFYKSQVAYTILDRGVATCTHGTHVRTWKSCAQKKYVMNK